MRIKTCSCCGKDHTTKTAKYIGRQKIGGFDLLLWNCSVCRSTLAIRGKKVTEIESDSTASAILSLKEDAA